jgi:hypothetical protein
MNEAPIGSINEPMLLLRGVFLKPQSGSPADPSALARKIPLNILKELIDNSRSFFELLQPPQGIPVRFHTKDRIDRFSPRRYNHRERYDSALHTYRHHRWYLSAEEKVLPVVEC